MIDNISVYLKNDYVRSFASKKEIQKAIVSIYNDLRYLVKLPARLSDTLQALTQGGIKTYKEINLSRQTMTRIEKLVNRLITGWVFGVLFIGSSLIFAYDIPPRAWGVPIIGLLGYAAAIISGLWLIINGKK